MGLKKLVVELTSLCNLDCEYCFKEAGTSHIDPDLVRRILHEARNWGASNVTYTGGEISLYPQLSDVLTMTETLGYRYAVVTNGWHFPRILPLLTATRSALNHIFFSVDSANEYAHDQVRGAGSYQKIISAVDLCRGHNLPFSFLVIVNQKNIDEMEPLAELAAKLGCKGMKFGHLLPTSESLDRQLSLSDTKRQWAESEAVRLNSVLNITVSFSAAARNTAPGACCEPYSGRTISIDCHGRLSLCCQLASYRGAATENDIVADLKKTDFPEAYLHFLALAATQRMRRDKALATGTPLSEYPCDFCTATLGKTRGDRLLQPVPLETRL